MPHHNGHAAVTPVVFIIADDPLRREAMRALLENNGRMVRAWPNGEDFLAGFIPGSDACLLIDVASEIQGAELLTHLHAAGYRLPAIVIAAHGDVGAAVGAMRAGATDVLERPCEPRELLAAVGRALEQSLNWNTLAAWRRAAADHIAGLTPRQREIMDRILAGHHNKNIAADLHISRRTVENHRAEIMRRTGAKSLPALARLALAARAGGESVT